MIAPIHLFGDGKSEIVAVEPERLFDVIHKNAHRPYPRDLERPRQENAPHIIRLVVRLGRPPAARRRDALPHRLGDFRVLGFVRQLRGPLVSGAIHRPRFGMTIPADLLDTVVQLVNMAVWIERIEMPVRARQVAPGAMYGLAAALEPLERIGHFLQRTDLPGYLVDRPAGLPRVLVQRLAQSPREEYERMVIGAVPGKVSNRRADPLALLLRQSAAVVRGIGDAEAEQPTIKRARDLRLHDVQAEMAQPANPK